MKHTLLALILALAPLPALQANDAPPIPSPAPLVEPTQRATIAMQAFYQQNRMLARLFAALDPEIAWYFDTRADAIAAVYELLFGNKIPEVKPGVQS